MTMPSSRNVAGVVHDLNEGRRQRLDQHIQRLAAIADYYRAKARQDDLLGTTHEHHASMALDSGWAKVLASPFTSKIVHQLLCEAADARHAVDSLRARAKRREARVERAEAAIRRLHVQRLAASKRVAVWGELRTRWNQARIAVMERGEEDEADSRLAQAGRSRPA